MEARGGWGRRPGGGGGVLEGHRPRGGTRLQVQIITQGRPSARAEASFHDLHVYLNHARRHDHAVATASMQAHAWDLCEAALCAHCTTSLSIPTLS